ncbi:hypothetical protein HK097_008867 [Rhizophlyctis rosea]|uniref:Expansin-like EG45 domain-containing protein n=1 Tax=Rhizophlyctis rosea TaxID=64517 RepID=A0AAD5SBV9_9FUNG|nr:hypothetical protein HK097_008867 [Rhizophlyctis rosea]
MHFTKKPSTLVAILLLGASSAVAQGWESGPCTYHDYEGDKARLGESYDSSPGWCGTRYSSLNVGRVTAVSTMNPSLCNKCLEIQSADGDGPSTYVLAIDQKGAPGLDVARSSFASTFPHDNPLDPQTCRWRVVEDSYCSGVCFGVKEECSPGVRNDLPAYLLPKVESGKGYSPPAANPAPAPAPRPTTTTTQAPKPTTAPPQSPQNAPAPAPKNPSQSTATTTITHSSPSSSPSSSSPSSPTTTATAQPEAKVQAAGAESKPTPSPQATALYNKESAGWKVGPSLSLFVTISAIVVTLI